MSTLQDFALGTAAVFAALGVIAGALWRLYRITERIEKAIGIDDEGHTVADNVSAIKNVLFPPGAKSLPLRVDELEDESHRTRIAVERIGTKLDVIEEVVIRKANSDE